MNRPARRTATLIAGVALIAVLCLIFPRALAFVEVAARQLRYLWWLVLILALGVWLALFYGKSKD